MRIGKLGSVRERLHAALMGGGAFAEDSSDVPAMRELYDTLERVVSTHAGVLIHGEAGSGRKVLAEIIHAQGLRSDGPLIVVHCGARQPAASESEPFGHLLRGASQFARAKRGTLLLDEISELTPQAQASLLHEIDAQGHASRGRHDGHSKARLICTTSVDLAQRVDEALRERIGSVHLQLPPLRERGHDVLRMAERFVTSFAEETGKTVSGLSHDVAERLLAYPWPGNVDELRSSMRSAVALSQSRRIVRNDLPEAMLHIRANPFRGALDASSSELASDETDERYVRKVMEAVGGKESEAMSILGISKSSLRAKLQEYRRR